VRDDQYELDQQTAANIARRAREEQEERENPLRRDPYDCRYTQCQ